MINNFKPKISAIFQFDRITGIWMVPMLCVKATLFKKFEMAAFDFCNFDKKSYDSFWYIWQNIFYKLSLPMTEPEPWCWNSFCKAVEGLVRKFSSSCPSTCSELEFLFRGLPSPQFNTYKMIIKNKWPKCCELYLIKKTSPKEIPLVQSSNFSFVGYCHHSSTHPHDTKNDKK